MRQLCLGAPWLLLALGCGGDASEAEPETSEAPAPPATPSEPPADIITEVREMTFSAALEIDLDTMEESESGLFFQVLRPGSGPPAGFGDEMEIHYTVWLPNGSKVASSHDVDEPIPMVLGSGEWIEGWVEGVTGMRLGESRKLVIPYQLAYGETGHTAGIPPYTPIVYVVELVEHVPTGEG